MKQLLYPILLVSLLFLSATNSIHAQQIIRQEECINELYKPQIDSLRKIYAEQGFEVIREASMKMESEYEMPIVVPMNQGSWYGFVFIGDPNSRLYEVRMYDSNERQVVYKKHLWGDVDGNIINFTYAPQFSEYHMIKPVQINKKQKKGLCGYVMLLKKVR